MKKLAFIISVLNLIFFASCTQQGKERILKEGTWRMTMSASVKGDIAEMKEYPYDDHIRKGNFRFYHPPEYEEQMAEISDLYVGILEHLTKRTGVDYGQTDIDFHLNFSPVPLHSFRFSYVQDMNNLKFAVVIQPGQSGIVEMFKDQSYFPFITVHEITEVILMKDIAMPDGRFDLKIFKIPFNYHTRWFREGVANYAGYEACDYLQMNYPELYEANYLMKENFPFDNPFSNLAKLKGKIFDWNNNQGDYMDHYEASSGVILLIEHKFGEDAVREIMVELGDERYLDHKQLVRVINKTLGADIEKMVEGFEFPRMNQFMHPNSEAKEIEFDLGTSEGVLVEKVKGSFLEGSAVKDEDVILAVDGKAVNNRLELEFAILEAMEYNEAEFTVFRDGETSRENLKLF